VIVAATGSTDPAVDRGIIFNGFAVKYSSDPKSGVCLRWTSVSSTDLITTDTILDVAAKDAAYFSRV
jgi:hypothetical protein